MRQPLNVLFLCAGSGVLVEVPVMLLVVRWANASKGWYERGTA